MSIVNPCATIIASVGRPGMRRAARARGGGWRAGGACGCGWASGGSLRLAKHAVTIIPPRRRRACARTAASPLNLIVAMLPLWLRGSGCISINGDAAFVTLLSGSAIALTFSPAASAQGRQARLLPKAMAEQALPADLAVTCHVIHDGQTRLPGWASRTRAAESTDEGLLRRKRYPRWLAISLCRRLHN
jgi:hypothetical protein